MFLESTKSRWLPRIGTLVAAIAFAGCAMGPRPTQIAESRRSQAAPSNTAVNAINESLSMAASQSTSSSADYRIGPDDLIQITIYNIPEAEARATPRTVILRASQDGKIVAPLIGEVVVKGLTTAQLEQQLRDRYTKYIRNPQIGVLITEYRQRVSVMGAVQKPGVFELTGPKTVIDMLAMAGGVTEKAGNQVHVYRQGEKGGRQTFVIDLVVLASVAGASPGQAPKDKNSQLVNMPVQAGDVINVPQAGMFFVDGAVGKPGSYPLGRNYTLTQALATAGGMNPELADYGAVSIVRREGAGEPETIPVDMEAVMAGRAPDPQVKPDDVIVVPMSGFKYFVKRFVGTIISGVSVGGLMY